MDFTRARRETDDTPVPLHQLPTRQRTVVEAIDAYERATGEGCAASVIARRLRVHHSTIQEHLSALYRKGWLRSPNAPAYLKRRL